MQKLLGSYVECSMGKRTCQAGHCSDCMGTLVVTKAFAASGLHTTGLAASGLPCVGNPCDPYCNA